MIVRVLAGLAVTVSLFAAGIEGAAANQSWDPGDRFSGGAPGTGNWSPFSGFGGSSPISRRTVSIATREAPGTIIINTSQRRLYYVTGNGQAIQYGIGV